jgi:hypothetical protein
MSTKIHYITKECSLLYRNPIAKAGPIAIPFKEVH